jgi:heme/copper-type cytochrome/quinol oxidase subunit 2
VLENCGQVAHDLHVPALGIRLVAPPNRTARVDVAADRPGRYDAVCTLPGHDQLGMRGAVVVVGR